MTATAAPLKTTPLHAYHQAHAKCVPFAGWDMPLQFSRVAEEHHAVRRSVGLFDVSHMGLLQLNTSAESLDHLLPQAIAPLPQGKGVYTQLLNDAGGIIDDLIITRAPEGFGAPYFMVVNASNTDKDIAWMEAHGVSGIQRMNGDYGLLALQGPRFLEVLTALGLPQVPKRFHLAAGQLAGRPVWVSRTGYTGEDGVELLIAAHDLPPLWEALLATMAPLGGLPVGLAARDTLRLEAAYPLHGQDITENDTPLEAGLGWSVKLQKATPFIGQKALQTAQEKGLAKMLHCFKLSKNTIPRQHDALQRDGEPAGEVTSGTASPTLQMPIGMGYLKPPFLSPGDPLQVNVRGRWVEAHITHRPFYPAR
jgi:aminomethyltransferase